MGENAAGCCLLHIRACLLRAARCIIDGGLGAVLGRSPALRVSWGRRAGRSAPPTPPFLKCPAPTPGSRLVCRATPGTDGGARGPRRPAGAMRSLPGLRGPQAPSLPLLLLGLLAAVRRSLEDGHPSGVMVGGPRSGRRTLERGARGSGSRGAGLLATAGGERWLPLPIGHAWVI